MGPSDGNLAALPSNPGHLGNQRAESKQQKASLLRKAVITDYPVTSEVSTFAMSPILCECWRYSFAARDLLSVRRATEETVK
jgi:membrane carboxypeptidase/penicillin-binding protein PbpC